MVLSMYLSALFRPECFCVSSLSSSSSSMFIIKDEARGISSTSIDVSYCCFFCCCCCCWWWCCCFFIMLLLYLSPFHLLLLLHLLLWLLFRLLFRFQFSSFGRYRGSDCWVGDGTSRCWGEVAFAFFRPLFTSFQAPSAAFTVEATTVAVVAVVGRGGGCVFLAGYALDMCPDAPHDHQYGLRPSTTTSIHFSRHISVLGFSQKAWRVNVTCKTMSRVAMTDLLIMDVTSSTCP